jgi:hypothetical protein
MFYQTLAALIQELFEPKSIIYENGALVPLDEDIDEDTDSEKEQQPIDFKEEKGEQ